ncbi:MAG: FtsQ-type POTRA domain-containing protein [Verrucomicrobia bacterium]|nr:FtsQ-type POTRA domain-containing protein [Verrucomicrobiota bacterium]
MRFGNTRKRRNQYLLDVKVHTEARNRARVRWVGSWLAAAVVISLTSYGLYRMGGYGLNRLLFENPRFAITRINVETDGALTPQQVMRFAGVRVGQNIFTVNLREAQRNLTLIPQVKSVEIRRELPRRLVIRLQERAAVARLQPSSRQLDASVFYVDRAGVVMKPIHFNDGTVIQPLMAHSLPVLTGAALADVRVGRAVESEQVYRALALLDALEQTGAGVTLEVGQIDLSRPRHLTLTTKQQMSVRFDTENYRVQLRRLKAILAWAQQQHRTVASVDLTVSRGVPVTFADDARAPRTTPTRRT